MSKIDNNKIKISGLEYLYDNGNLSNSDTLRNIPLKELFTFREHPFFVVDDEKMAETVESIRKYGVLNPGIARPRKGGGYELISGHRRKRALDSFLNSIINVNQNGKIRKYAEMVKSVKIPKLRILLKMRVENLLKYCYNLYKIRKIIKNTDIM